MRECQFPDDVLEAAKLAAYSCEAHGNGDAYLTSEVGVDAICAAIIAERKRCAKIARKASGSIRLGGINSWSGASNIADEILGGR